jgi:hypothetical protein
MEVEPASGRLLSSHANSFRAELVAGIVLGVLFGFGSAFLEIRITLRFELALAILAAFVGVTVAHEGIHGLVGLAAGHRPRFGFRPTFVFTTFRERIPRGQFLAVILAPLILLDAAAFAMLAGGIWPLFSYFAAVMTTIGSIADVWMAWIVLRAPRGSMVQDTKTGFEVWSRGS